MHRVIRICRALALAAAVGVVLAPASLPALAQSPPITCVASTMSVTPISGTLNLSVTCTSPASTTPVCSLSASQSVVSSGAGGVTVTANNCATPLTWSRLPGPISSSATGTFLTGNTVLNDNFVANGTGANITYTYSVTDSLGATATTAVVQQASSGTGGGTTSCGTPVAVTWKSLSHWQGGVGIPIPAGGTVAMQFTVPAGISGTASLQTAFTGINNTVSWTIASAPCVLLSPDPGTGAVPFPKNGGTVMTIAIGGTGSQWLPAVQPGGTYFVNAHNSHGSPITAFIAVGN